MSSGQNSHQTRTIFHKKEVGLLHNSWAHKLHKGSINNTKNKLQNQLSFSFHHFPNGLLVCVYIYIYFEKVVYYHIGLFVNALNILEIKE